MIPTVLVLFSGLDAVGYILLKHAVPFMDHMEWWLGGFQYSSNTTQFYWVFNQSIPIWVIMALLLQARTGRYIGALASLAFAYSPWATIGIIPIAFVGTLKKGRLREAINPCNVLVPLMMLVVFGGLYMAGSGGESVTIGLTYSGHPLKYLVKYGMFVFLEAGVYFLVMGRCIQEQLYYRVVLVELVLFPLFIVRDGNFIMRGSIPALFLLMVFVMTYLLEYGSRQELRQRTVALLIVLCIGAMTPLVEINRSVINTATKESAEYLETDVGSLGNVQTQNIDRIHKIQEQFFCYDYEENWYFRYLVK